MCVFLFFGRFKVTLLTGDIAALSLVSYKPFGFATSRNAPPHKEERCMATKITAEQETTLRVRFFGKIQDWIPGACF